MVSLSSARPISPVKPLEWIVSQSLVDYPYAIARMEERVAAISAGLEGEMVWLLEHPPLYTAGTSAKPADLRDHQRFFVYETGRGGQYTYHGPGQRVAYVMLDLKRRGAMDVRAYVKQLERWIIATLSHFGIESFVREGRVGVWTHDKKGQEAKIAAIGIRIRKWVTYHGISINISPDLSHYSGIIPCGISEFGITSFQALGIEISPAKLDSILTQEFNRSFTLSQ